MKYLRAIKRFFIWFISLFKKEKEEPKKPTLQEHMNAVKPERHVHVSNPRTIPHNNRKRTRGRHIQICGCRTIYHTVVK